MSDWLFSNDDIVLTQKEDAAFREIRNSDCEDLVGLMKSVGYDPATFFEHGDWTKMDFRGSDVRGVSFAGAIMTGAILYRDQFEAVRKTRPRTLDKVRVQESRAGGKRDLFTLVSDAPLDPGVVRAEFRSALIRLVDESRRVGRIDWATLASLVQRMDSVAARVWALGEALEATDLIPGDAFFAACAIGYRTPRGTDALRGELAHRTLSIATAASTALRLKLMTTYYQKEDFIEFIIQTKLATFAKNSQEIGEIVEKFNSMKWLLHCNFFSMGAATFAKDLDGARAILALMDKAGVRPDASVFAKLAEGAKNLEGVRTILALMDEAGVRPDASVFTKLAEGAKNLEGVRTILALMDEAGVRPDTSVFSQLANGAKNLEGVRAILALMDEAGVRPDTSVFSRLANGAKNLEGVRAILALMDKAGVRPDASVFSRLADGAKNLEGVRTILALMDKAGVRPDASVFAKLAEGAKNLEGVRTILALMDKAGVRPDASVFAKLANGAKNLEGVRAILALMDQADVRSDERHHLAFLAACGTVDEALEFLDALAAVRRTPGQTQLGKMLNNAPNATEAERIWDLFPQYRIVQGPIAFNTLIKKMATWEDAWRTYLWKMPQRVMPTGYTFNPILQKARNRGELQATLNEMTRKRVRFDEFTVRSIANAEISDADALWAFDQVTRAGFDATAVDQEFIGEKAERFLTLIARLRR
ncbi:MAG: hypothetical protein ING06_20280 [Roseomonas sp.]|nr:hypothetical protein [Roseomonas sp.]